LRASKQRIVDCVCVKWAFLWFLASTFLTNTHVKVVVVRQNVCGVRVWTWFRDMSMFEGVGRKFRASKQRIVDGVCVKWAFLWFLTSSCFTNTHGKVVVVRRNVRGVPVWTWFRDICMFAAVGRKLRASNQRKVDCVCINILFLRLLTSYLFTNTHVMVVVVRQNVCGVPVWTWFLDMSMFEAVGRKLRRQSSELSTACV
jgi:hypothetical protein